METICAIATAPGGALGIVRVSGDEAVSITQQIFQSANSCSLLNKKGGTLTFGTISDPENGELVDEVVVSLYRAPHSYTGEDSTEISCHGSSYIIKRIIELLIAHGCRMAHPGEYTERAFLNGKMDLSRAEAVADLIASTTAANHRIAMQQMRGGFSRELHDLRDRLLHLTSLLELELDFSDHEDLEFADRSELLTLSCEIHDHIDRLCRSFHQGNALRQGIPVAIVGETNAGKSTLLNALVGDNRALVSDIHGTTRDTVEEVITMGEMPVRLIDTAGLRDTTDTVERMGIDRSHDMMSRADVIIWMLDATSVPEHFARLAPDILPASEGKTLIAVINKSDTVSAPTLAQAEAFLTEHLVSNRGETHDMSGTTINISATTLAISAHSAADITRMKSVLADRLAALYPSTAHSTTTLVSNLRHYEALSAALTAIDRATAAMLDGLSGDLVSQDLRECLYHLSDILGEVTTDEVLGNIFKHFCVGK